ncbi:hypothetical protein [Tellurirhabdus rosea]|uniref:hypothetical protein n=1 Tax=Tellurirhabdus rosea TaxID=2674997 RepID=UPI00225935AE|nr:hypothetical protein [Tellurirhabdus rosea]
MQTYYTVVWQGGESSFRYFGSEMEAQIYLHQLILTRRVNGQCRMGLGEKRTKSIDYYGTPDGFVEYMNEKRRQNVLSMTADNRRASRSRTALGALFAGF